MPIKILVIDDDAAIRRAFTLALQDTCYELETADGGFNGIQKVKDSHYDLIFLDLRMPDIDGIEVLKTIRRFDRDTPIYIITAFAQEYFSELAAALQSQMVFEVLNKPVTNDQIIDVASSVLH